MKFIIENLANGFITHDFNIIIMHKSWDNEIEMAVDIIHSSFADYSVIHEYGQSVIDRYLKLSHYW